VRVIPVLLDDAELPPLLRSLKWLWMQERAAVPETAMQVLGLQSERDYLKAIQETIDMANLPFRYFPGYGVLVACPRCGTPAPELDHWHAIDERRDDEYGGAKCKCGWEGGGELW
jgi:hypothetical protein